MVSAKVLGVPSVVKVKPPQTLHPVFLRIGTTDLPMYHQVFTSRQYELPLSKPPHTIIDCGGNVGYAAVYFANIYPEARIFSIEPEISNYIFLAKNVAPYPNIIPFNGAVWKRNILLDVNDEGAGACSFRTRELAEAGRGRFAGRTMGLTIDSIMTITGMDKIDLLKIDVEGAEDDLFVDPTAWIERVGVIAMEIHDDRKPDCRARIFRHAIKTFQFQRMNGENVCFARSEFVEDAAAAGWSRLDDGATKSSSIW